MKYIPAEQFLKADRKVQNSIMQWWKPEEYDLVYRDSVDYIEIVAECYGNEARVINEDYYMSKYTFIPLLTTQQLIDYIEWRTGYGIEEIKFGAGDCYWVEPYFESDYSMEQEIPRWYGEEMSFCDEELIKALWKCVCEVATDDYYN